MNKHPSLCSSSTSCIAAMAAATVLLSGCQNMNETQKGTAAGAGVGALAGAVISSTTGGKAGTGAVLGGIFGGVVGNVWSKRQEERRTSMEKATKGTGVEVTRTPDNQLKLNVPSDISFDIGSANIRPELRAVLEPFVKSLQGDVVIRLNIVGHTDSTGSDTYNNTLSIERAQSVSDFLTARGVSASRINVFGRGEREPLADNSTETGRAHNRRVEIFLREPGQPSS